MKRSGWLVLLVAAAMVVGLSLLMPAPPAVQGAPAALLTPAGSGGQAGMGRRGRVVPMIQIRAVQDVTIGTAAGTLRLVVGQTYAVDEEAADHAVRGRYAE